MKRCITISLLLAVTTYANDPTFPEAQYLSDQSYPETTLTRIAFGSCNKPKRYQTFWDVIRAHKPDLMLLLGDNHYVESTKPSRIEAAYKQLETIEGYMALRAAVPTFAIWDNHDYGAKYPGRHHPNADAAERLFLEHFRVPEKDARRSRTGIYGAWIFGKAPQRVQIIMLDSHRHRDYLLKKGRAYVANPDQTQTILGDAQWTWLEVQLKQEADLRIIGTSIQVLSDEHTWRRWGTFPHEKDRLLTLLEGSTGFNVILSGDRHRGEISRLERPGKSPLYDVTASAFNACYRGNEPNVHRVSPLIETDHYGCLDIDWSKGTLTMQILASKDSAVLASEIQAIKP